MCLICTVTSLKRAVPYTLLACLLLLSLVCFVLRCTSSVSDEEALTFVAVLTLFF